MIHSLILFLFSSIVWSQVNLELKLQSTQVKQGEIVSGKILYRSTSSQFPSAALKGKTIEKTLYLLQLAPFMGKQGQDYLEADAKVIFLDVPKSNRIAESINGQEVSVSWSSLEVQAIDPPKSFLFGDFDIPERVNFVKWFTIIFGLGGILILVLWIFRNYKRKKTIKQKLTFLKNELLQATSYDEIVAVWQKKHLILSTFPKVDEAFRKFEVILFKYQFKQQRKDFEIKEVQEAYESFKSQVKGVLDGI